MLISTVLNFQTPAPRGRNDLPYRFFPPTYTATAWHHKKLPPRFQNQDLKKTVDEAQAWALGPYLPLSRAPLAHGGRRAAADRGKARRIHGLPREYVGAASCALARRASRRACSRNSQGHRPDGRPHHGRRRRPAQTIPRLRPEPHGYVGLSAARSTITCARELTYDASDGTNYEFLSPRVGPVGLRPRGQRFI